jgi:hypothetical protein
MSPVDFYIGYNNYKLSIQGLQAQYTFSNYISFWLIFIPNSIACQWFFDCFKKKKKNNAVKGGRTRERKVVEFQHAQDILGWQA